MEKNLFNFDEKNSSNASGLQVGQITCEPFANECKKIEIKSEEIDRLINIFSKED